MGVVRYNFISDENELRKKIDNLDKVANSYLLQIIKRRRAFRKDENSQLQDMTKAGHSFSVRCAAHLLLGNNEEA